MKSDFMSQGGCPDEERHKENFNRRKYMLMTYIHSGHIMCPYSLFNLELGPCVTKVILEYATSQQTPIWDAEVLPSELKAGFLAQSALRLYEVSEGRVTNVLC